MIIAVGMVGGRGFSIQKTCLRKQKKTFVIIFSLLMLKPVFATDIAWGLSPWRKNDRSKELGSDPFCSCLRLVGGALDLLVDVEEADLVHGGEFCNQVDGGGSKVDKEGEGCVVGVMGAEQEPKRKRQIIIKKGRSVIRTSWWCASSPIVPSIRYRHRQTITTLFPQSVPDAHVVIPSVALILVHCQSTC